MHVCLHGHTHMHIRTYTYTCAHLFIHANIHTHRRNDYVYCIYTYVCVCTHTHIHTHARAYEYRWTLTSTSGNLVSSPNHWIIQHHTHPVCLRRDWKNAVQGDNPHDSRLSWWLQMKHQYKQQWLQSDATVTTGNKCMYKMTVQPTIKTSTTAH